MKTSDKKDFELLFGMSPDSVQRTCIVVPFLTPDMCKIFHVHRMSKGLLFGAGNTPSFTLIHSRMGSCFTGDSVLYLKETGCRDLFFFGSCGAIKKSFFLSQALLLIKKATPVESFSNMLEKKKIRKKLSPNKDLYKECLSLKKTYPIKEATCLTVGSLALEKDYIKTLKDPFSADVADMETSAFFAAARHIGKRSVAFHYATDHITRFPYTQALCIGNRANIQKLTKRNAKIFYQIVLTISGSGKNKKF